MINTVARYTSIKYVIAMPICGFARKAIERFFLTGAAPRREGWSGRANVAKRKLDMLDYSSALHDLSSPPGSRLEALKLELKGELKGYHSIRINEQWRIVFKWTSEGPSEVDIRDYHD
jgi:proteic killer suppression protein